MHIMRYAIVVTNPTAAIANNPHMLSRPNCDVSDGGTHDAGRVHAGDNGNFSTTRDDIVLDNVSGTVRAYTIS